ncbi:hypothetical protein MRX96_007254 [Rhipicephalus microplus]
MRVVPTTSACVYSPRHEQLSTLQATAARIRTAPGLAWTRGRGLLSTRCPACSAAPCAESYRRFPRGSLPAVTSFASRASTHSFSESTAAPLDQTSLAYDAVETRDSVRGGIYQLRALCPNSSSGCSVVAFLLELKEHFASLCDFIQVQFPCCGTAVLQKAALSHYLDDCAGTQR